MKSPFVSGLLASQSHEPDCPQCVCARVCTTLIKIKNSFKHHKNKEMVNIVRALKIGLNSKCLTPKCRLAKIASWLKINEFLKRQKLAKI